jgi:hypothetical protein
MARTPSPPAARCSFCGKRSQDVAKLIAGPGAYICDECVGLCTAILERSPKKLPATVDWAEQLDAEELLQHIGWVARADAQIEESLRSFVGTLRARGVTWARIGDALGMARQSAWERFSGEE